jgi:hypothetical protein
MSCALKGVVARVPRPINTTQRVDVKQWTCWELADVPTPARRTLKKQKKKQKEAHENK